MAIKSLLRDKTHCHIHFKMDNKTAVAQLNKMGGTKSENLLKITRSIWEYCLAREITLTAEYLPGTLNQDADQASRMFQDSSDWMLNKKIFTQVEKIFGKIEVDLFANRLNAQKQKYVSWKPDPGAMTMDAFTVR